MILHLTKKYWVFLFGIILLILIVYRGLSAHAQYKNQLVGAFQQRQAGLNNAVRDNFRSFLDESYRALGSIAFDLQREKGVENGFPFAVDLYSRNRDNFYSISAYRAPDFFILETPADSSIETVDQGTIADYLKSVTITEFPHLSHRIFIDDTASTALLIVSFEIDEITYYMVGALKVSRYAESHISFLEKSRDSFFLANSNGEILSLYNGECEDIELMKAGNIFSLETSCLDCHNKQEFDHLKADIDMTDVSHHVHQYFDGDLVNRSTNSLEMFDNKWLICICTPYNEIQGLITENALYDAGFSFVFVLAFIALSTLYYKKQTKEALLVAETESLRQFRDLSDRLSRANNMKDLLLDIITHDIQSPASVIHGFAEILMEKYPEYEEPALILSGTKNLIKTVQNATSLAQVTRDQKIPIQSIFIGKEVASIVQNLSLVYKKIEIKNNIPENLIVKANPIISEVFHNYIGNAQKYAASGKRIVVDHQIGASDITFQVKDFGTTIPEIDRERIFERGIQLSKNRGSGLGLTIVKKIAEAHGGTVWVEPNTPEGNIFAFRLPN